MAVPASGSMNFHDGPGVPGTVLSPPCLKLSLSLKLKLNTSVLKLSLSYLPFS